MTTRISLATLVLGIFLSSFFVENAQGVGSGYGRLNRKRENSGFYTTRFGRSDPDLRPGNSLGGLAKLRDAMRIGYSIEGFDDRGQPVACISAGQPKMYICQREQQVNWNLNN